MGTKGADMKKLLMFICLLGLWAILAGENVILVNYVITDEGGMFMQAVKDYLLDSGWATLVNEEQPGDICLFIKEYWLPPTMSESLRSFTVTVTVVEEPFGDYAEYVPLSKAVSGTWFVGTEAFVMDANDMRAGLNSAMEILDTELYLFLASYGNIVFEDAYSNWEERIQEELGTYCAQALQWYKTPVSQGGAGQMIGKKSAQNLASFLGFDPDFRGIERVDHDVAYSIGEVTSEYIMLRATPMDDSYVDGPLYTGRINLRTSEIKIVRNPLYD